MSNKTLEKNIATKKSPEALLKELKERAEKIQEKLSRDDAEKVKAWVDVLKDMTAGNDATVADAKEKIENGFYLTDDATRKTAQKILEDFHV
ncbi:MAG: hypothetical protein HN411_02505 [Waddliaceae bacterium]|jgi:hypothetical protein|nr:hypothetical protein [Waddliaceae bacterium]MBT3578716.1 hypothetical protein [Waddliaceae bacterium]MBT4444382.1 hypothetical protein [Waddliaceae bacterium]MBT6928297.1 hypothetical protein [Waddliaceae bacterium]MBT7264983.1 hypothetical protein [Waddliaceae bacterium]